VKLKLDENLPLSLKARLARGGHDVDTVADENLQGAEDPRVPAAAGDEGRLLLTLVDDRDKELADAIGERIAEELRRAEEAEQKRRAEGEGAG
jgi:predicted nuclease of predicted toxin-antitoxin system